MKHFIFFMYILIIEDWMASTFTEILKDDMRGNLYNFIQNLILKWKICKNI